MPRVTGSPSLLLTPPCAPLTGRHSHPQRHPHPPSTTRATCMEDVHWDSPQKILPAGPPDTWLSAKPTFTPSLSVSSFVLHQLRQQLPNQTIKQAGAAELRYNKFSHLNTSVFHPSQQRWLSIAHHLIRTCSQSQGQQKNPR